MPSLIGPVSWSMEGVETAKIENVLGPRMKRSARSGAMMVVLEVQRLLV